MAILGLLPQNAQVQGSILYKGKDLLKADTKTMQGIRGKEIGFIPQSSSTSLNPVLRIQTQFVEALRQISIDSKPYLVIRHMLHRLGLEEKTARMYPHQLSEGMKGRILAGLSLCLQPRLILADEPTSGLDIESKREMINMFKEIIDHNDVSLLMITHDLDVAEVMPGSVAVMYAGEIVEIGSGKDILNQIPLHPYTKALLQSMPQNGLHTLPGNPPNASIRSPGCRFAARCNRATSLCKKHHPKLKPISKGHLVRCLYA
jgi:peptide/nickel transport system ATP-binding protein